MSFSVFGAGLYWQKVTLSQSYLFLIIHTYAYVHYYFFVFYLNRRCATGIWLFAITWHALYILIYCFACFIFVTQFCMCALCSLLRPLLLYFFSVALPTRRNSRLINHHFSLDIELQKLMFVSFIPCFSFQLNFFIWFNFVALFFILTCSFFSSQWLVSIVITVRPSLIEIIN